jgi:hypothetical protein
MKKEKLIIFRQIFLYKRINKIPSDTVSLSFLFQLVFFHHWFEHFSLHYVNVANSFVSVVQICVNVDTVFS